MNGDGGAIYFYYETHSQVLKSTFLNNSASSGGAILFGNGTHDQVLNSTFLNNSVSLEGGAICFYDETHTRVLNSTFVNNSARVRGGALSAFNATNTSISKANFTQNISGKLCGALCVKNSSKFIMDNSFLISNSADERGGGVCVMDGSLFLCRTCLVASNQADYGGGIYIFANTTDPTVAQFRDSTIEDNTALSHGGAIDFFRTVGRPRRCKHSRMECNLLVLLNTTMINNSALISGAAILATLKEDVLLSCNSSRNGDEEFLNREELKELPVLDPKDLCNSWTGNHAPNKTSREVIAFYPQKLSFSTKFSSDARIVGNLQSGFTLENIRKGYEFPNIFVQLVDGYNSTPTPTNPYPIKVTIEVSDGLFSESYTATITQGVGNFSSSRIVTFKEPGNHTLQISSNYPLVKAVNISVIIRECRVGEELTRAGEICQECDDFSYNFDPTENKTCATCSDDADCTGPFIAPKDGFWHRSPCHPSIQQCLNDEACLSKTDRTNFPNLLKDG